MSGKAIRETLGFLAVVASLVFVRLGDSAEHARGQGRCDPGDRNSDRRELARYRSGWRVCWPVHGRAVP